MGDEAAILVGPAKAQVVGLNANRNWQLIGSRTCRPTGPYTAGTNKQSVRYEFISPVDLLGVRVTWMNTWTNGIGENPFPARARIKWALQPQGSAINASTADELIPMTCGGREAVWVRSGGIIEFELAPYPIKAGVRYFLVGFIENCQDAPPAAPTLTANTSGGGLSANTYTVSLTYMYPDGRETQGGATAAVTTTGSTGSITVTSPAAVAGAIGYKVYAVAGTSTTQYENGFGVIPFGTNATIVSMISTGANSGYMAERVMGGQAQTFAGSAAGVSGGTSYSFSPNNGEGRSDGVDYCIPGRAVSASTATGPFGPVCIEGIVADGQIVISQGYIGDSIGDGTGDVGFQPSASAGGGQQLGGAFQRVALNQVGNRGYATGITPAFGHVKLSTGGERGDQFAAVGGGTKRKLIAAKASTISCNYGTNDLSAGATAATVINTLFQIGSYFTALRKKFIQRTLLPRTNSTDGHRTIANQTFPNTYFSSTIGLEGHRRAINNVLLSNSGAHTLTDQPMFASRASGGPATSLYTGDGTARVFIAPMPFVQGSETIKVAGVAKALTTDYTYTDTVVINGVAYASAVTLNSAAANAEAVTVSGTSIPGFKSLLGALADVIDWAAAVEVDANGVSGTNGGFWKTDNSTLDSGTSSGLNSTNTINDTSKSWAVDQWRGYTVLIASDPGNPSAVGQVGVIGYNTATKLSMSVLWAQAPSNQAQYIIYDGFSMDGIHPSTRGHMAMGAVDQANKPKFS